MAALKSVASLTLDLPPSCIQFCPSRPDIFVVGTYYLHGKEHGRESTAAGSPDTASTDDHHDDDHLSAPAVQKRTGSLILFRLDSEDKITRLSTSATDFAVLDLQWRDQRLPESSQHDGSVLAVAASTGLLAFYRLSASGTELALSCVKTVADSSTLVLSLAWHPSRAQVLGLTLSDGSVCWFENKTTGADALHTPWTPAAAVHISPIHSHELEAWTSAFAPAPSTDDIYGSAQNRKHWRILSGGDDMALWCSNLEQHGSSSQQLWQDRKLHSAGVTAILPLSARLVLTGSYDDHIRLLWLPDAGRRRVLADLDLGGGVWRLKMLRDGSRTTSTTSRSRSRSSSGGKPYTLLASCMHAGPRIVRLTRTRGSSGDTDDTGSNDNLSGFSRTITSPQIDNSDTKAENDDDDTALWTFDLLARFEEHGSMNYGSDTRPPTTDTAAAATVAVETIVSTSFYDRLLCLWRWWEDPVAAR